MIWTMDAPLDVGKYWFRDHTGLRYVIVTRQEGFAGDDILWGTYMRENGLSGMIPIDNFDGEWQKVQLPVDIHAQPSITLVGDTKDP